MRMLVGAMLVLFVGALAYGLALFGPVYSVELGTPIRHDDFTFTVRSIHGKAHTTLARGYEVVVDIENQARVVNYTWRDRIAYVRDGSGPEYYSHEARKITIAPGQTARVYLHFVLPAALHSPQLRFWDGVFMGDALNRLRYARAALPLTKPG